MTYRASGVLARSLAMVYSVMPMALSTRKDISMTSKDMEYPVITMAMSMREGGYCNNLKSGYGMAYTVMPMVEYTKASGSTTSDQAWRRAWS